MVVVVGGGGENDIAGGVDRGLKRILDNAGDEADGDNLCRDATPEAPQAEMVENRQRTKAVPKPTSRPKLCAAAKVRTVMVTAEAFILSVAPKGMDTA